jgi:LuxR family maltose regulon positive regulatory protein
MRTQMSGLIHTAHSYGWLWLAFLEINGRKAAAALENAGHHADVLGCSIALGDIEVTQGRLHDARRTYERGLRLSAAQGQPVLRGSADMHVGLPSVPRVERSRGRPAPLDEATELGRGHTLQHPTGMRRARRAAAGRGRCGRGPGLLEEAEVYDGDFFPEVHPVASARTTLGRDWPACRRAGMGAERGLSADDEPAYLREDEHISLARALLAGDGRRSRVDARRRRSGPVAGGGRGGRQGTIRGRAPSSCEPWRVTPRVTATAPLPRWIARSRLPSPERYVRLFLDEGRAMPSLAAAVRRVPASCCDPPARRPGWPATPRAGSRSSSPLSERELRCCGCWERPRRPGDGRRARRVLNTLRTHTKNIFAKLG